MELGVTTASTMVVLIVLLQLSGCLADKLSPGQKAPAFAKGSGGLALKVPYEQAGGAGGGPRAADVGRANPPAAAPEPIARREQDGVTRQETEEFKQVDGQLVRVVKGNFAYDSPEGLAIAVKYVADENGNRASFTFGTAGNKPSGGGGGSRGGSGPSKQAGLTPGGPGVATSQGGSSGNRRPSPTAPNGATGAGTNNLPAGGRTGQSGPSTYLPPTTTKVDRSYLPPN